MTRSSSSGALYDDVFGGPRTGASSSSNDFSDLLGGLKTPGSRPQPSQNSFADDLLGGYSASKPPQATAHASSSSLDDIFSGGLGQTRTSSHNSFSAMNHDDDPFSSFSMPKPEPKVTQSQTLFDDDWNFGASKSKPGSKGATLHASIDGDLLGGFSTSMGRSKEATPFRSPSSSPPRAKHSEPVFDEFLPGFGGSDHGKRTAVSDADAMRGIPIIITDDDDVFSSIPSSTSATTPDPFRGIPGARSGAEADASRGIPTVTPLDADEMRGIPPVSSSPVVDDDPFSSAAEVDPFANIIADSAPPPAASHTDPLDPFNMPPASASSNNGAAEGSDAQFTNGAGSYDPFDGFPHPSPVTTSKVKESTPSRSGSGSDGREGSQGSGTWDDKPSRRGFGGIPFNVDLNEAPEVASPTYPSGKYEARTETESNGFAPKFDNEPKFDEPSMPGDERSRHDTDKVPVDIFEEKWLTVDDLKLLTAPSATRPPSRAPPRPGFDKSRSSRGAASQRDSVGERSAGERSRGRSDEVPAYRGSKSNISDVSKEDELARERAAAREREAALVQKEREAAERERAARQKERAERQRERERQMDRLREQETSRNTEPVKERVETRNDVVNARDDEAAERARKAAERAAKEAQHRMEKAAAERAIAEARERAEKAALQRAAANREKEQREKELKEREEREKREREERARRERAKEERERREREERERREREEREKERERDRERDRRRERERGAAEQSRPTSGASSRATSEPRQRPPTNQPAPSGGDVRRPSPGNPVYSSTGSSPVPTPAPRTPQPSVKAVDDWTTFLTQTAPTGDEFQEIPGETAERRKLRMERHQKTIERAQQALKEKNDRDKALAMEQAERSRSAGNLDAEIRRWATGKEGNLRALLSSLHLVLWPETNWKPVSLTDLITGMSVKKAYQRAILCVHPDKVQQKGATVQQKYIAEKVFDLLKEAFAKFNSTELY